MSHINKSEEHTIEEELKHRLTSAIITYNKFIIPTSSEKKKEQYMPDGDRILNDIRRERDLKVFHFSEEFYDKLEVIIKTLMKDLVE